MSADSKEMVKTEKERVITDENSCDEDSGSLLLMDVSCEGPAMLPQLKVIASNNTPVSTRKKKAKRSAESAMSSTQKHNASTDGSVKQTKVNPLKCSGVR